MLSFSSLQAFPLAQKGVGLRIPRLVVVQLELGWGTGVPSVGALASSQPLSHLPKPNTTELDVRNLFESD